MRIISGKFKGLRIVIPKKIKIRPTTNIAKEGIFNTIINIINIDKNTKVLDLFSGTGNISLEFASRGCEDITSIDISDKCLKILSNKIKELNINTIKIIKNNVLNIIRKNANKKFDIIFADPPFNMNKNEYEYIIKNILEKWLEKGGIFILEHNKNICFDNKNKLKKYGDIHFSIFLN